MLVKVLLTPALDYSVAEDRIVDTIVVMDSLKGLMLIMQEVLVTMQGSIIVVPLLVNINKQVIV